MANNTAELRQLVAEVAAAYFSHSHVSIADIPDVVRTIAASLSAVDASRPPLAATRVQVPATPEANVEAGDEQAGKASAAEIRHSISHDRLISFEDGRSYKTLKRHLTTRGLTPAEYREKWGLPLDYPMVCASSSLKRSALAKQSGLGQMSPRGRKAMPKSRVTKRS